MNAQQRKYLIERIQAKTRERIKILEEGKEKYPSAPNFLFKAVLNGTLQLQPSEVTLEALRQRALNAKEGYNWLSDQSHGWEKESTVKIKIQDLIAIPEDYKNEMARVQEHNAKIEQEIKQLRLQLDTIEMRVQLASDKTLQRLINEVDDMGELSLIDTKIKLLS